MDNMAIYEKNDPKDETVEFTELELQKKVSEIFFSLCPELGMDENLFFEIIGFLSEESSRKERGISKTRTYPKLSAAALKKYRREGLPRKYVFKGNKDLLRSAKKAIAMYIGRDIADMSEDLNGAFIERYPGCLNLPRDHVRKVEENWRNKRGKIEMAFFECYEAARMLAYPEGEATEIKNNLDDIFITLELFEKIKANPDLLSRHLWPDEYSALNSTLQQVPEIMEVIKNRWRELNNRYTEYILGRPK